jgi:hypothetical protein
MDPAPTTPPPRGIDRRHRFPGRQHRIHLRFDPDEHRDVTDAAARAGLTPTGFCAETALAAARRLTGPDQPAMTSGLTRAEVATLQRGLFAVRNTLVRLATALAEAITAFHDHDPTPPWLGAAVSAAEQALAGVDRIVAVIDRRLR